MGALDQPGSGTAAAAAGGGPAPCGLDAAAGDTLLSIPAAVLHEVSGGRQRLLAQGPLRIAVVDVEQAALAPGPATPRPAPAAPAGPTAGPPRPVGPAAVGRQQPPGLYPPIYKPPAPEAGPQGGGSKPGSSASLSSADTGASGSSLGGSGGASITLSVDPVCWELLPASQTLKVGQLSWLFSTADASTASGTSPDTFYAVTLSAGTSDEVVGVLEAVLESASVYRESESLLGSAEAAAGEAAIAERAYRSALARGVAAASARLSGGLLAGAALASSSIERGAAALTPAEATASPLAVSPGLKKRFRQSERLARYAASAVNSTVSGLAWVGAKVAGGVLWLAGADQPLKPGEEAGTLREVGHAAVVGFTEVWDGMEQAGATVLLSARDSTAGVVRQRYGEDAAEVSVHSMNAAGSSAEALLAARKIGVRTVAKAAAKRTAKGVIRTWAGEGAASKSGAGSQASSGRATPTAAPAAAASAPTSSGARPAGAASL